jgi:NodT family efflux transporter outer membrane factor (OMF) lipoprotein
MTRTAGKYRFSRLFVACMLCGTMVACSTVPPYTRPSVAVPAHYAEGAAPAQGWTQAAPGDATARGPWWTLFHDPELNALEARVDVSNQTIKKAVTQLREARAMVDYQRSGFFPTVSAGVAQSRTRTSQNLQFRALAGKTVPDYSAGLSASWEPDLFGKVSDNVQAAQADAQASASDLEAVRLAVSADLAADYFDLRASDTQKKLLDDAVTAYTQALNMVQQQFQAGAVDPSVVAQAQTQLETTRAQDTDLDVQRAQLQHAIATLIGEPASTFALPAKTATPAIPPIPEGLPSQLLERRPDIAAAERRVAAANARVGEARAAFFPSLMLSASAGLESTLFAPWLTAPSLFWSLGPQLAGTLFDGGRRTALKHVADAQYDGTIADYRQSVLTAFQQVEDNLAALNTLADEAATQQRAVDAANLTLRLMMNRYRAGAVDYLQVVTAQTVALANQRTAQDIARRREDASVALLKALGGGWGDNGAASVAAAATGGAQSPSPQAQAAASAH